MRVAVLCALACAGCFDFGALRARPDLSVNDLSVDDLAVDDLTATTDDLGAVYAFSLTLGRPKSLHYGGHDKLAATIKFTSTADSAQCSHDGAQTFAVCDTPSSIVFTPDDYNQQRTLAVKLSKSGFADLVYSFQPSQLLPGLHFYNCDQEVTADEPTRMFQTRIAPYQTICLDGGITILDATMHNDDAGMHINTTGIFLNTNATGVKILGVESNRPLLFNPDVNGDQGVFVAQSTSAVHDAVFSNLRLTSADGNPISFEYNAGNNSFSYLDVKVLGGCCDSAIVFASGTNNQLYNVDIDVHGSPNTPALNLDYNSPTASVTGGTIIGRDDVVAVTVKSAAILQLTNVTIDNSTGTSNMPKLPALQLNASTLTMTGGSIASLHDIGLDLEAASTASLGGTKVFGGLVGVNVAGASTATLANVVITTDGIGIKLTGSTLAIDRTEVERLDQVGSASPAINVFNANTINSSQNGNHLCDQNVGGANKFSSAIVLDSASNGMFGGSFVLANQVNGGVIDQCP